MQKERKFEKKKKEEEKLTNKKDERNPFVFVVMAGILIIGLIGVIFLISNLITKENMSQNQLNQTNGQNESMNLSSLPYLKVDVGTIDSLGSTNAKIKVIEFGDFQCPYCKEFYDKQLQLIKKDYINTQKVSLFFRDSPFANIHDKAIESALTARCANEQNSFWQMHDLLFEKQNEWSKISKDNSEMTFENYAKTLNLNSTSFNSCLESKKYQKEIDLDLLEATKLGVTGTPTFFILLPKNVTNFEQKINQIRVSMSSELSFSISPYQNENYYVVVISGIIEYKTFKTILDIQN